MSDVPLLVLNSSVLTSFGTFDYRQLDLSEARELVQQHRLLSAVGHESTALALSELLQVEIAWSRLHVCQDVGQSALVFRLSSRGAEAKVLSEPTRDTDAYTLGLLYRSR